MTVVTVDSNNLEAILADAGVAEAKPEAKTEVVEEVKAEQTPVEEEVGNPDADDIEGPDGLTPRDKREMSAKMLKAIGKKHRQAKEAEEFAGAQYREKLAAEARAADLEARLKALEKPEAQPNTEPKREDFATDAEFVDARTDWLVDQKLAQRDLERQAADAQARTRAQLERAMTLVPDFQEVTSAANMEIPSNVVEYMRDSDMFAEIGYHFAKNPAVMKRIQALSPVKQLVEVGKIVAILTPFEAPKASKDGDKPTTTDKPAKAAPSDLNTGFSPSKPRSDAPVIRPLTSGEGQQVEPEARDMDVRDTIRTWQKANKANLHLRKRH